ncbi:hypothetical protein D6833_10280 [Candidatus Parcubacteria bacterium]|nr:MAG: hypothetical protein D6833_10280 [Candidatus Parcubacteria bacterium]
MVVDALVEGVTDEAVARKLIAICGHRFGVAYGKRGHDYLRQKAAGFNERARYGNPILMLVDFMDTGFACPPEVPSRWLPHRHDKMLIRAAVPELESWLLADSQNLARFLGIAQTLIPKNPEAVSDPKQTLVSLARRSRSRALRDAIVPPQNISAVVGPGYSAAIEEFVEKYWSVHAAVKRSPSLQSCVKRLRDLR